MTLEFEPLTETDVPAALRLSAEAGWGMREIDWRRMVSAPWIDAIGGRADGDLAATATVIRYGRDLAWIGSILVDEERRRRGHGTAVFDAAVSLAADCRVAGLDANDDGKPIYGRAGFEDVAPVEQWSGVLDPDGDPAPISRTTDAADVAAIDRDECGVDRSFLLESLLEDPDATAYHEPGAGYALVTAAPDGPTVGPVVSASADLVPDLLAAVAADHEGTPVTANVVASGDAVAPFRDAGLAHERTLTRMVDDPDAGVDPLTGPSIRAITGFAYG